MASGTLLRTAEFVVFFLEQQAEGACDLIAALLALPLAVQDKCLLLHASLQPCMAHLSWILYWGHVQDPIGQLEDKLADAVYSLMHQPRVLETPVDDQEALPLRHGLGLWCKITWENVAARCPCQLVRRGQ
jgi:hypothetical protein